MHCSTIPDYLSCAKCTFAPFCLSDKKHARSIKPGNNPLNRQRVLRRHEVFCQPKNKFQNLYVIQEGAVKTYQVEADGKELIRGFYFAGEILGYEAIATGHYLFSAVALQETLVCEIPYENFLELVHSKSTLQKRALYLISKQLSVGSYLLSTTAEQRVAAFLLDLSERLHPFKTQTELVLPMSRQDIGNYLRLTAETVSRVISRLQKQYIIAIQHKHLDLLQLDQLKQIADGLLSFT